MIDHDASGGLSSQGDAELVQRARRGERCAFGVLYLRHHEAAWRLANAVSGFSPDDDVTVVESFARVFAILPRRLPPDLSLRHHLLVTVRRITLERASPSPAPSCEPDADDLDLSAAEHVAVVALRRLGERERTALWLSEVEALTARESGIVLGLEGIDAVAAADAGRREFRLALREHFMGRDPRCHATVRSLPNLLSGRLSGSAGEEVRSHLAACLICRMRRDEITNVGSTLRRAVPAAPLLGGECQRRWLEDGRRTRLRHRRKTAWGSLAVLAGAFVLVALARPGVAPGPISMPRGAEIATGSVETTATQPERSGGTAPTPGTAPRPPVPSLVRPDEGVEREAGRPNRTPAPPPEAEDLTRRVLSLLPEATTHPVEGGRGLYVDGVQAGVVADDRLYLWSAGETRYMQVPSDVISNVATFRRRVREAVAGRQASDPSRRPRDESHGAGREGGGPSSERGSHRAK